MASERPEAHLLGVAKGRRDLALVMEEEGRGPPLALMANNGLVIACQRLVLLRQSGPLGLFRVSGLSNVTQAAA